MDGSFSDGDAFTHLRGALDDAFRPREQADVLSCGIAQGTHVYTLDGVLPVEFLGEGDRIITRSGARRLRKIHSGEYTGALVQIAPGALGQERPESPLLVGGDALLKLNDWRVAVAHGTRDALVPALTVIDGCFLTSRQGTARMFRLEFDMPEVIYADGVEVGMALIDPDL